MNDKIEVRQDFREADKIDTSDPSKLSPEDFEKIWARDCFRWHDKHLTGSKRHYCPDWDFLPIDETCMEFEACTCNWTKE